MSEQDIKKALNNFLGLTSQNPDEHMRPVLRQWEKMQTSEVMPDDLKQKGWDEVLRRKISLPENSKRIKKIELFYPARWATAACILILISAMVWKNFSPNDGNKGARLVSSQGSVFVNKTALRNNDNIGEGSFIESADDSYRLQISPTVMLDVQYKSRLRFYKRDGVTYIDLQEGGLAAVINSSQVNNRLKFLTPAGEITVKGTVFYTRVISPNETYFCICHGEVELSTKNHAQVVQAAHHGGYSMVRINNEEKIVPDTMKYHQDPLLDEMANSIGYKINW